VKECDVVLGDCKADIMSGFWYILVKCGYWTYNFITFWGNIPTVLLIINMVPIRYNSLYETSCSYKYLYDLTLKYKYNIDNI